VFWKRVRWRRSDNTGNSKIFLKITGTTDKYEISYDKEAVKKKIASDLKKAGILTSKEGISGGYSLAKKPADIRLLDVLKVLDGELVEGKCFEDGHECSCGAGDMWADMKAQMEETIGRKTVADLVV